LLNNDPNHLLQTRAELGWLDCQLCADNATPFSFSYCEQWAIREEMYFEARSLRFGMLLTILENKP
jgi:hypothetical protein